MVIKNFVYCFNVDAGPGNTNIMGLISAMSPDYIPGLFSFSINFTLLGLDEGKHSAVISFVDPNGEVLAKLDSVPFDYKKDEASNLPDEYLGINIAANFQNVNFRISGIYHTEIIVDETPMGQFEIFAKGKNE